MESGVQTSIEEHFTIAEHLYSTRCSDGYRAVDKGFNESVLLWLLRYPLSESETTSSSFRRRVQLIGNLTGVVPELRQCGIDPHGKPFLALEYVSGRPAVDSGFPFEELQRIYWEMLNCVAPMHQSGLVLGDICEDTFLIDEQERVRLIAPLGTFEVEARNTAMIPTGAVLNFISPEQRSGASPDPSSDVYALGVLGYRLFAGRYMYGDRPPLTESDEQLKTVPAPSTVRHSLPQWVDDIIGRCVATRSSDRYANAEELLDAIQVAIETGESEGSGGPWSRKTVVVKSPKITAIDEEKHYAIRSVNGRAKKAKAPEAESASATSPAAGADGSSFKILGRVVIGAALVAVIGVSAVLWGKVFSGGGSVSSDVFPIRVQDAPAELQEPLQLVFDTGESIESRTAALEAIINSGDPLSLAVLGAVLQNRAGEQLTLEAQKLTKKWLEGRGLVRTAHIVSTWYPEFQKPRGPEAKSNMSVLVLTVADSSLSIEARKAALHKIYAEQSAAALQLAAALSLDGKADGPFVPVFRQLAAAHQGRDDLGDKSTWELIIADSSLTAFYAEDITKNLSELSPTTLSWALKELSNSGSSLLLNIADEALQRKYLPPFGSLFLKTMVALDSSETDHAIKRALAHGAVGAVDRVDIGVLARWYAPEAEDVLLAVCATSEDKEIALSAFDALATRTIFKEPAKSLFKMAKGKLWSSRSKIVKAIGILANHEIAGPEQAEYALDTLVPLASPRYLWKGIYAIGDPSLSLMTLERLELVLPSSDKILLLKEQDKALRMAGIKSLEGSNDLSVLQAIVRNCEREKDPEVKELYRQIHWACRDR